ncbi:MAG: glycine cleavage system aminomethyltransferase GcvT [Balneolales bacterium]
MRTVFFDIHQQLKAKIIDFGGFDMPVQYSGIQKEHLAVRNSVGLFDVSHMGEVYIRGKNALKTVQNLTVNDASRLAPGKAQYSCMCYESGGIVDDLLVYMIGEDNYLLVINASNIEKDYEWMLNHNPYNAEITNASDDICLLAVQGPNSPEVVGKLTNADLSAIRFYTFTTAALAGFDDVMISATGYTGEKGYELYFDRNKTAPDEIWKALMEAGSGLGIQPAGLGARDTLRLEMGYPLYGNDIHAETNPFEAGLGWITKLNKEEFIGKEALEAIKSQKPARRLVGFRMTEKNKFPRKGYAIHAPSGQAIGEVSSGGLSVCLGYGIGLGYVSKEYAEQGTAVNLMIRNKAETAEIMQPPFYKKSKQ